VLRFELVSRGDSLETSDVLHMWPPALARADFVILRRSIALIILRKLMVFNSRIFPAEVT
jgi:hypothetical protein